MALPREKHPQPPCACLFPLLNAGGSCSSPLLAEDLPALGRSWLPQRLSHLPHPASLPNPHVPLSAPVYPQRLYSHHAQTRRSPSPTCQHPTNPPLLLPPLPQRYHHPGLFPPYHPTMHTPLLAPSDPLTLPDSPQRSVTPLTTSMPASALNFPSFSGMANPLAGSLHRHPLPGRTWGGRRRKARKRCEGGKGREVAVA